jgi:hypothetical protein
LLQIATSLKFYLSIVAFAVFFCRCCVVYVVLLLVAALVVGLLLVVLLGCCGLWDHVRETSKAITTIGCGQVC